MGAALLQILLVPRWQAEWLVYLAQATMLGAYVCYRLAFPQPIATDAVVLTLIGLSRSGYRRSSRAARLPFYVRPTRYFSLVLPVLPLVQLSWSRGLDDVSLFHLLAAATFYGVACGQLRWKSLGYAAAVFYNAALWVLWSRVGWRLSDHFQFFLVPVGLSTILFAEVNRRDLGRAHGQHDPVGRADDCLRLAGRADLAVRELRCVARALARLAGGNFRSASACDYRLPLDGTGDVRADVCYEMGHVSLDYAFAKWAIMLALGIALVLFVALNEKKEIVAAMRLYYGQARLWE